MSKDVIEGRMDGKRPSGRKRIMMVDDILASEDDER